MRSRRLIQAMVGVVAAVSLAACGPEWSRGDDEGHGSNNDVNDALALLPNAEVLEWTADGLPKFIVGELIKVGEQQIDDAAAADAALRPQLAPVLAPFRLVAADLVLRKLNIDEDGNRHFRYQQVFDGLPVIGGDLVIHVDIKGAIFGINGAARGDLPADTAAISGQTAVNTVAADSRFASFATASPRDVYIITAEGTRHRAYEVIVEGTRGADPARDAVYVDAATGDIVAVYPTIHFARNRKVHSANNGSSLPGSVRRSEGQAATSDIDVNAAYDNSGDTYDAYNAFWSRDSFNNAGAQLTSTVHYQNNYCNAFWNGSQMVYGDGNGSSCLPLARSLDVTGHELTHAVTQYESGLNYSGESGGMNEALSDIFGAFVEAWVDGGRDGDLALSSDTWLVGEDILPPYLRNMCDPAADGVSKDAWYSGVGSVDVHYSSGVGNLAFCLLTRGGTHPRNATTTNVPAQGMDKAIRIMYRAQTDYLTSTSNFASVRNAMEQAATALGYDQATRDAVGCAWAAVKVGTAPTSCGGGPPPPPPPGDGTLSNGVAVTGLGDSTVGSMRFWKLDVPAAQSSLVFQISGGTGDADMYVQFGSKPTTTVYQCRPYLNGNNETCTFTPPSAGTYWVGLQAYTAYSGVTLKGTYSTTGGGGDPYLTNGVPVTGISGSTGNQKYWRINVPAGKNLQIRIQPGSGSAGDADLYTRFNARPTTSTYACRPYLNGNNETCNHTTTSSTAGDWFVMLRAYTNYSGVTLIGSY
jgi:vibriolysin